MGAKLRLALMALAVGLTGFAQGRPDPPVPALLFKADFDGTVAPAVARGAPQALETRGVSFVDGKRGKALRFTHEEKSLLSYSFAGNVVPERGTVAMWVKREWPDAGHDAEGKPVSRILFSTPVELPREGTGALFAWFHGAAFRGDESDADDRYATLNLGCGRRWVHLAMSWDESGVRLAVNGRYRSVGSGQDMDSPLKRALKYPNGLSFNRLSFDRFYVGSRNGDKALDGGIDDFRIYSAPLDDDQLRQLYLEFAESGDDVTDRPDYRKLFADKLENPHLGTGDLDLEQVEVVKIGSADDVRALTAARRFNSVGTLSYKSLNGVGYLECGKEPGSRFALRLDIDPVKQPLYCIEIDYPDDAVRTMDFLVQDARSPDRDYTMQVGVAAGGEWTSTGRILTHRCLLWARSETVSLVGMSARRDAPVAVSEVRLYKVGDSRLPPLKIREPAVNADGWRRTFALYFEDPAIGYDFAVPGNGFTSDSLSMLIDRTAATMKYTGENMLAYPGVWYQGRIGDFYNPRNHAPDFLSAWYEKFDREGLFLMPTLNPNNMPVRRGLITRKAMDDGTLHASPVSIHSTGRPNWGGWHGTPPNFNIAHPSTQKWLEEQVDALLAQGKGHPSFKGLGLYVSRHGMVSFGGIEAGYNDYCIAAFERAKGIRVPVDRGDALRGAKYAAWIREHAYEAWLDWRCETVATFWGRMADKLKAARPDLKLLVNMVSISRVDQPNFLQEDWALQANREMGVDPVKMRAAADNIILAQTFLPADFRWRNENAYPRNRREACRVKQRDLFTQETTWALLKGGAYPWVGQHDRYWESAIGTGKKHWSSGAAGATLSSDWMKECTWRVSTINPSGRNALAHFAVPLRYSDVLGMSKGGFLIGTYGMESELRPFMAAFRALPAVVMKDVGGIRDDVVLRQAEFDGRSYFYICNTSGAERRVRLRVPRAVEDLVTGEALSNWFWGREVELVLAPYELRSYVCPSGQPERE